ncbi:peptidase families S8 and S53 domain protein [Microscilla marina ATCC 23134]|uniref:Peptidase families S8 and S53 domain protein n=2 Tax=Microscilla marina TaxID=1027 RepID=A1ZE64_MICM2|nr:peptidase families S8 and S53 domain protein [Microscilla marina ATCC 23134]
MTWLFLLLGLSITSAVSVQGQQRYDKRTTQQLNRLSQTFSQEYQRERKIVYQKAKRLNIPIRLVSNGRFMELQGFSQFGTPIYNITTNDIATQSISTDRLHNELELTGAGLTLGIWDGGAVKVTHQEFAVNGLSRVTQEDGGVGNLIGRSHATHVAGTLVASGVQPRAKGVAPMARLNAYDWTNDLAEMTAEAARGLLLSNHSYGWVHGWSYNGRERRWQWYGAPQISEVEDYNFGFYTDKAQALDRIAAGAPNYLICWAAGNDRNEGTRNVQRTGHINVNGRWVFSRQRRNVDGNNGYDCIGSQGTAKNVLTVGAVNDVAGGYKTSADVVQTSFSSWGPTDDGRIKPDLVANGMAVYSSNVTARDINNEYINKSGTSMATPTVTGSLGLLQRYYHQRNNNTYMRSATLKALAIHTTDEAGPANGPDYQNGWGLMNAKKAADVITNRNISALIQEQTLNNNGRYTTNVNAVGGEPLSATIVWTDVPGTPVAPALDPANRMLVNDLDILITHRNEAGVVTTHLPWILDPANPANAATRGDNSRDNVEKIFIANPVAGTYTITVTHKGALHNNANQAFSMIVTGIRVEAISQACGVPVRARATNIADTTAKLVWGQVNGAASYDVRYHVQGSDVWTQINSIEDTTVNLPRLISNNTYEFQVRSRCEGGISNYAETVSFTTTSLPEGYCAVKGTTPDEYINRVQFGAIDNTSGNNDGYKKFSRQITTTLRKGITTRITITPSWTNRSYQEGYRVWIDLNRDGDFNDPGEALFSQDPTINTPVTGEITIPATAATGKTIMRVAMRYNQVPLACGEFLYGEVEDYEVNIIEAANNNAAAASIRQEVQPLTEDIRISPNPASTQVTVQVKANTKASFVLMNSNGIALQTKSVEAKAKSKSISHTFDVSQYQPGMYLLVVQVNGSQQVKRVIVLR